MTDFSIFTKGSAVACATNRNYFGLGPIGSKFQFGEVTQRLLMACLIFAIMLVAGCSNKVAAPSDEFLNTKLMILSGPNDHGIDGSGTVRKFVEQVSRLKKFESGQWETSSEGYVYRVRIVDEFELNFRWNKAQNQVLLQEVLVNNKQMASGMQFLILVHDLKRYE